MDKQEDDFTSWPVIVAPDGTIRCGFDMTVRSVYKGSKYSDTCISDMKATVYWVDEGTGWVTEG